MDYIQQSDYYKALNITGKIGHRTWQFDTENGVLVPTAYYRRLKDNPWAKSIAEADIPPTKDNRHGLYAYPLYSLIRGGSGIYDVMGGMVELRGKIVEHADGVLRGEWARILELYVASASASTPIVSPHGSELLYLVNDYSEVSSEADIHRRRKDRCSFIKKAEFGRYLSNYYHVPVVITSHPRLWAKEIIASNRYEIVTRASDEFQEFLRQLLSESNPITQDPDADVRLYGIME